MTHPTEGTAFGEAMEVLSQQGTEGMLSVFRVLLDEAMKIERSRALGAEPYQRSAARRGHANGFKPKTLDTRVGRMTVAVPQTRGMEFYPSALERGVRSDRALTLAIAEMYVQGISTRKVTAVLEKLCGLDITSTQVSRASELLDEELSAWRNRPLGEVRYLILDARFEKVRHGGSVISCALLIAIGVLASGGRTILGVSVSLSEAEVHWRNFLSSLIARGMHGILLIASDDHAGLKAARESLLCGVPWQRCQFHLMQDAMAYVPKLSQRSEVAQDLKAVFDAPDRPEAERRLKLAAEKYRPTAPALSGWMESAVPEGLTVFAIPPAHRRKLRTTNALERLNKEIKRRTRVATLFPNEASLLRLASAVLSETSDEWETDRTYLSFETE